MGYLFSTGIIGAITAGMSLVRGSREQEWTWRTGLAWLSWGITLALAIGAMVDVRRERQGRPVPYDSPRADKPGKRRDDADKQQKKTEKQLKKSGY